MEFEKSLSINKLCATKKNIFSEFPEIFCLVSNLASYNNVSMKGHGDCCCRTHKSQSTIE